MTRDAVPVDGHRPSYVNVGPFLMAGGISLETFQGALEYKARDDDIFIATYPKNGTTWTQQMVFCIMNGGRPPKDFQEFMARTPFLEMQGKAAAENLVRPAAIKVHLPYHLAPQNPNAKYIVVVRNIKDTCVSFFHHTRGIPLYSFEGGSFDVFFELFAEGQVDYGSYLDWILSWIEHKNDPNVLFLTYEGIKGNSSAAVAKIASFLGPEYEDKVKNDPDFVSNVLKHSSVDFMKGFINQSFEQFLHEINRQRGEKAPSQKSDTKFEFVRKGVVNDWKSLMSPEQSKRLSDLFRSKAAQHPVLYDIWDNYDWL